MPGGWPGVPERRRGPANYLADVERAMTAKLRADQLYSGFTCKNPLHKHWVTLTHDHPYSLGELHGWLGRGGGGGGGPPAFAPVPGLHGRAAP